MGSGYSASFLIAFLLSLLLAFMMAVYPMSHAMSAVRPEFVCLVIMFWVLFCPRQVGVGIAWVVGLAQDIVEGGVWGGHALALSFVAYLCINAYQRLRNYSVQQQTAWVFVFVTIHQMFVNWFQGLEYYASPIHYVVGSSLVTALFWPVLVLMMRKLQRQYRAF